jgi:hypothetical protein
MNLLFVFNKKNNSKSRNELEKILNINNKYFRRILKFFTNCLNINHKNNNSWSICHIAEQNSKKKYN